MIRALMVGTVLAIGVGALALQVTRAEQAPAKGNKGFKTSKTQVVDLGTEIEGMKGRQLRLRILHIEPGGQIGVHDHKNRPAVVYVISGETTMYTRTARRRPIARAMTRPQPRTRRIGTSTKARSRSFLSPSTCSSRTASSADSEAGPGLSGARCGTVLAVKTPQSRRSCGLRIHAISARNTRMFSSRYAILYQLCRGHLRAASSKYGR